MMNDVVLGGRFPRRFLEYRPSESFLHFRMFYSTTALAGR